MIQKELSPAVEDYVARLEPWQQSLFFQLRQIILSAHPMIQETYSYSTPFYKLNGLLCYFTLFGKDKITVLGLCDGHLIVDEDGVLTADAKQKYIRHIKFNQKDLPALEAITRILDQAVDIKIKKRIK